MRERVGRVKQTRLYDHIIGDAIERQLAQQVKAKPVPAAVPKSVPVMVAPQRDAFELARVAGSLLKGSA